MYGALYDTFHLATLRVSAKAARDGSAIKYKIEKIINLLP